MKSTKNPNRIKPALSSRNLKIVAVCLTIFWLILLIFPTYWMLVSSFQERGIEYEKTLVFTISWPKKYTIMLDYTAEEAGSLGEDGLYWDANYVIWNMWGEYLPESRIGMAEVIATVDGEAVASYSLSKYIHNTCVPWTVDTIDAKKLDDQINVIKKRERIDVETEKIEWPEVYNRDEITEAMLADMAGLEELTGTVTDCTYEASPGNLFDNYKIAVRNIYKTYGYNITKPMMNSVFVAVMKIVLSITLCSMAAYAISRLLPPFLKTKVMLFIMMTGMIPGTATLLPKYQLINTLHIEDTLWALILPALASFSMVLLFKGTFDAYPSAVLEAARIDGAGELFLFARIAFPAAKGLIGCQILMIFAGTWNEYFWPNMVLTTRERFTVALIMCRLMNETTIDYPVLLALGFIISIPTLLIYIFFQKYLSYGFDYSGLKG